MLSEDQKTCLEELIAESKLEEAINKFQEWTKAEDNKISQFLIILKNQYNINEKENNDGILKREDYKRTWNQLTFVLLELIDNPNKTPSILQQIIDNSEKKQHLLTEIYINPRFKYSCNRTEQLVEFEKIWETNKNDFFQLYLIHGDPNQKPDYLYERLFLELIQDDNNEAVGMTYIIEPLRNTQKFRIEFLKLLFKIIGAEKDELNDKLSVKNFTNIFVNLKRSRLVLNFVVESKDWNDVSAIFKYLLKEFGLPEAFKNKNLHLIIFITLNYSENNLSTFSFKRKVKKIVKNINPDFTFPGLTYIETKEVRKWIEKIEEDIKLHFDTDIKGYLMSYFRKKYPDKNKCFTMSEIADLYFDFAKNKKIRKWTT